MSATAQAGPALLSELLRRPASDVTHLIRRYALAARSACGCRGVRVRIAGPGPGERLSWSAGMAELTGEPGWTFPLAPLGTELGALELFGKDIDPDPRQVRDCAALAGALVHQLERLIAGRDGGEAAEHPALVRAVRFILCHYRSPLRLAEVARHARVSKSHLSHLFQQQLDTTFVTFVNRLRVDHAQRLLLTRTELSVTRVALRSGFSDLRQFQRVFKAALGCTATELRRRGAGLRRSPKKAGAQESSQSVQISSRKLYENL